MTTLTLHSRLDRLVTEPAPPLPARRRFHRDLHAPKAARTFTADTLARHGIASDVIDTAVLLVDEMVTNAALYAGRGHITVEITVNDKQIRVAVTDAGRARADAAMNTEFDEMSESGRGWFIVAALAADCGIERLGGGNGNRVYFVLDRDPGGAS